LGIRIHDVEHGFSHFLLPPHFNRFPFLLSMLNRPGEILDGLEWFFCPGFNRNPDCSFWVASSREMVSTQGDGTFLLSVPE
jgi:hypothetical protein